MEIEIIKELIQLGSTGICILWIYYLRKDVSALKVALDKKEDDHKADLKTHSAEMQAIYENLVAKCMEILNTVKERLQHRA